jgi:gliding motility-associated-like protein
VFGGTKKMTKYFLKIFNRTALLAAAATLCGSALLAQPLTGTNWYFGNSPQGFQFGRGTGQPTLVTDQATPFGTGGGAVASEPGSGKLLFYTDGNNVYDGGHRVMPNGSGLFGNAAANQPAAICKVPGEVARYFIFTNTADFTAGGTIHFSIVNRNLFGNAVFPTPARGDVETRNTPVPGLSGRSEGMIVIGHANGEDFWLITHQSGTQNFAVTLINAASFTAGTFATTAFNGLGVPMSVANFAYHEPTRRLAVSAQNSRTDAIVLSFNPSTGVLAFDRTIFNSGVTTTTNQLIYDMEWSLSGRFLYLSRHGEAGVDADVLQYDYLNSNVTLATVLPARPFRSYGLQMALDSSIYHLYQAIASGPFLVGRLRRTDTVAAGVLYSPLPFGSVDFAGTQFPSFLARDTVGLQLSFVSTGSCQNSPTTFFASVQPAADSIVWDFGDARRGRGVSPIHTFEGAGSFNVRMYAFFRGQVDSVAQVVTINQFPLRIQLVPDTTACRSEFPPPRGTSSPRQFSVRAQVQGGTPTSIVWSNGDTGPVLTPDSSGYYYVVVTDAGGCTSYAGVNVREYGLQDQTANIWYFGRRAGIDFNVAPPRPLNDSAMDAPEGCAIVCDRNGQTIFYTDGNAVFDRTHTQIDTGIGGDPDATQSALIVPVPGDETLYYIFTTQAINGTSLNELRYSLFDIKPNSGRGAVVRKNVLLFRRSSERITSTGPWLVAHEWGTNFFRAYPISANGIGDPVVSSIGSVHSLSTVENGQGYMKFGPNNNLAVPISTPGTRNIIELFHLNDSTGRISNLRRINLNEPNGQVYGIEFSNAGNKLFASVKTPSNSYLFEYFLDSLQRPFFKQRIPHPRELGAIQLAPDGQIFMAINGSNVLATIQALEDTTRLSTVNFSGFTLAAGTNSRLGLPNFRRIDMTAFGGPLVGFEGICLGDTTRFNATPTDPIDQVNWFFGDGGSGSGLGVNHLYAAPRAYTVTARFTNRCGLDTTLVQTVNVVAPPPPPTLASTALCVGPVTLDANAGNLPGLSHLWSTGDTTRTLVVSRPVMLTVLNTDINGCSSFAQALVADNRPLVELGPDLTICEDSATPALNAQNPGAVYEWRLNGTVTGTSQTQFVDTSTPGIFRYEVTVTDPITTCVVTDTRTYTINVSPAFVLSGTNPTTCGTPTGSLTLTLNPSTPAGGPYQFFLTGPGGFNQQGVDLDAPSVTGPITGRAAGTYSVVVSDQVSGCSLSSSLGLTDATFTISAAPVPPNCDPVVYNVVTTAGAPLQQVTITNNATGVATTLTNQPASFATPGLPAGTYVLQVRDNAGCINSTNLTVSPAPVVPVTLTPNLCVLTLTASGATGYSWSSVPPAAIAGPTNQPTISLTPNAGTATFTVTATAAGQCPATQSVTLNVGPGIATPSLLQSTACAPSVVVNVTPAGPFLYRWYRNGALDTSLGGSSQTFPLAQNGTALAVEIFDPVSGCSTPRSGPITLRVVGNLTVGLASTPPCQDGQPFTLTATPSLGGATFAWERAGAVITGVTSASTQQMQEGLFRVTANLADCRAAATLNVVRAPLPEGALPNRVVICNDPENLDPATSRVQLDPGPFQAYAWFKNELPLGFTSQVFTADSQGRYEVLLTNSYNCQARDATEVLNDCVPTVVAPNAFRPGSHSPENREFRVFSFFVEDDGFQVYIFNRWGELVFSSTDRNFRWNGTYNNVGAPLPPGTYAYVVKYVSSFRPQEGVREKRGGVALLR